MFEEKVIIVSTSALISRFFQYFCMRPPKLNIINFYNVSKHLQSEIQSFIVIKVNVFKQLLWSECTQVYHIYKIHRSVK